jgi:predicted AlkP superfamily pyrophosphatase or phosphodiesterase
MLIVQRRKAKSLRGIALLGAALALLFIGARAARSRTPAPPAAERHVVVISVDGMGASWYMQPPPGLHIPNIDRLKAQGSFAEGVEGVYPSVTYPSHTTIVTGRMPAEHGVYSNLSSRVAGKNTGDWFWFAKAIKVPTLWDEARRAHLTSVAISWPVTAGAAIDWDVPEIWNPAEGELLDFAYLARFSTPGLIQEAVTALHPQPGMDGDVIRARFAAYLLKKYKPNLLLLHLNNLDHDEHEYGPGSSQAARTLEQLDVRIGEVLDAIREAGLDGHTDVFVVSDHGFLSTGRAINPNVLLAKAGLLAANEKGEVTGGKISTLSNGGSFFIYWPKGEDYRARVIAALKPLLDQKLVWAVFDPSALADLGAEPAIRLALDAPAGALFDDATKGELVVKLKRPGGAHGYLPFRQGLESSFIAWGPDIKPGVDLHRIRMTAIGPTILKALGIDDPKFGDQPPLKDIFK